MVRTVIKISGMMCGMCEAHINDAVRSAFEIKKVTSSKARGETVIISDAVPDQEKLRQAIESIGYEVKQIDTEPYVKKGLFR